MSTEDEKPPLKLNDAGEQAAYNHGWQHGIAHQKEKERWRKYPEEKPVEMATIWLFNEPDHEVYAGWLSPEGFFKDATTGNKIPAVTHWKPIELPEGEA